MTAPSLSSSTPATRGGDAVPRRVLPPAFFERPATEVAPDLLGAVLCRARGGTAVERLPLTEVEAYEGFEDRASHAHRGRTPRNEVMFGPAGHWYLYLCYGVHWLANIVTGPPGHPGAVLLRGAGDISGPGRLTRALGVGKAENTRPAVPASRFWIEAGTPPSPGEVITGPRVGVHYAGSRWAAKPWRWILTRPSRREIRRIPRR